MGNEVLKATIIVAMINDLIVLTAIFIAHFIDLD